MNDMMGLWSGMDGGGVFAARVLLLLAIAFLGGLGLGYAYFRLLRHTADLIVHGGAPLLGIALTLGRMGLLGGGLYLAVLAGAPALLSALTGVLCAKALTLAQARRAGA